MGTDHKSLKAVFWLTRIKRSAGSMHSRRIECFLLNLSPATSQNIWHQMRYCASQLTNQEILALVATNQHKLLPLLVTSPTTSKGLSKDIDSSKFLAFQRKLFWYRHHVDIAKDLRIFIIYCKCCFLSIRIRLDRMMQKFVALYGWKGLLRKELMFTITGHSRARRFYDTAIRSCYWSRMEIGINICVSKHPSCQKHCLHPLEDSALL